MNWDLLEYDGYLGAVLFDPDDGAFHGTVINTRDGITFVGRTPEELRAEFRTSVDIHRRFCERSGRGPSPPRPFVGGEPVLTHLPPALFSHAERACVAAGQSLDEWVADRVAEAVAAKGAEIETADVEPAAAEPVRTAA